MNQTLTADDYGELHKLRSAIQVEDSGLILKIISKFGTSENPYLRFISERKMNLSLELKRFNSELLAYLEALIVEHQWSNEKRKYKKKPTSLKFNRHPFERVGNVFFSVYLVTLSDFRSFVENTGYAGGLWPFSDDNCWRYAYRNSFFGVRKLDLTKMPVRRTPVFNVSWLDAKAYCRWISEEYSVRCRLPTQAEWRYASTLPEIAIENRCESFDQGKTVKDFCIQVAGVEKVDNYNTFQTVGSRNPNPHGLYDLGTLVSEWCEDWLRPPFRKSEACKASWSFYHVDNGIASPSGYSAERRHRLHGFRCVFESESS